MAADLTFGRIGLATSAGGDGLEVQCDSWSQEGDQASVSGVIRKQSAVADVKSLRDQFQGYGPENTDEPVIPVTWAKDSSRDGFYRVLSCDVSTELSERLGMSSATGPNLAYKWTADLQRVPGFQAPVFEVMYSEKLRVNSHAIVAASTNGWLAVPGAATALSFPILSPTRTSLTAATLDTVTMIDKADPDTYWGAGSADTFTYRVAAANYYDGTCRIESGSSNRTVVGDQVISDPANWRITNDLVRVAPSGANLVVGVYDSAAVAWETKTWSPTVYDSANTFFLGTPETVTILRNSPETCIVRLAYDLNGAAQFPSGATTYTAAGDTATVDIVVRRGARWIEGCTTALEGASANRMGIYVTTAEAATAVTGGVEATAADGSGNKYRAYTPSAKTNDLAQGGFRQTSLGSTFPWGVGTNASTSIASFYFTTVGIRQRVVAA